MTRTKEFGKRVGSFATLEPKVEVRKRAPRSRFSTDNAFFDALWDWSHVFLYPAMTLGAFIIFIATTQNMFGSTTGLEEALRSTMRDPDSLVYRVDKTYSNHILGCYKGRNGFNGYTNYKEFVYNTKDGTLSDPGVVFTSDDFSC